MMNISENKRNNDHKINSPNHSFLKQIIYQFELKGYKSILLLFFIQLTLEFFNKFSNHPSITISLETKKKYMI